MKTGPSIAGFMASQSAAAGILAALYERDTHSGDSQHIDISLLDTTIAAQSHYLSTYLAAGVEPQRRGTEGNGGLPSQAFPCADRDIIVICGSDAQYRQLCEALGHSTLANDERFSSNERRLHHRSDLAETFASITRQWRSGDLLSALKRAGIPCAPIYGYTEVFSDPHVVDRGVVFEAEHELAGSVRFCASPIRYTGVAARTPMVPPLLGQHTEQILREALRMGTTAIQLLRDENVI